jgi:hypothetical protein
MMHVRGTSRPRCTAVIKQTTRTTWSLKGPPREGGARVAHRRPLRLDVTAVNPSSSSPSAAGSGGGVAGAGDRASLAGGVDVSGRSLPRLHGGISQSPERDVLRAGGAQCSNLHQAQTRARVEAFDADIPPLARLVCRSAGRSPLRGPGRRSVGQQHPVSQHAPRHTNNEHGSTVPWATVHVPG